MIRRAAPGCKNRQTQNLPSGKRKAGEWVARFHGVKGYPTLAAISKRLLMRLWDLDGGFDKTMRVLRFGWKFFYLSLES
jgi:hypothetical protein